ncbi:uncharacterized protein LODBEIA_P15510 [Lodderomyces beijingensis]|uniref:Translation initiation factor eIF2B subunit gamma n=1 Tax=Lodderomyces beijingensis TaxID=1775926 RepID=A0ABP0ZIQ2_9ASCO
MSLLYASDVAVDLLPWSLFKVANGQLRRFLKSPLMERKAQIGSAKFSKTVDAFHLLIIPNPPPSTSVKNNLASERVARSNSGGGDILKMEFTAVIFCGKGKALTPFSETRSTGIPKALIPVANKPILSYVLDWCQSAYFAKIVVVTSEETGDAVQHEIYRYKQDKKKKEASESSEEVQKGFESTPIELMPFTAEHSGEVVHFLYKNSVFRSEIENFIIMPCDFVTNLPPQVLIEAFRNTDANQIGLSVAYKNQLDIEDKKSKTFPKSYTVYSNSNSIEDDSFLLDHYGLEDIEASKMLQLRTQMCWRYPNSIISTKLLNSGIFLGSNKIFEIIQNESDKFTETYFQTRSINKIVRDLARRSWRHSKPRETVGLMIIPREATFFRVNNLPVWMEANRYFMKQQAMNKGSQSQQQQQQQSKDKAGAHVGNDSMVGEQTVLGEKTNVKKSVIGANCIIGKKVRLNACLLLDRVKIEDDVQLDNCIIGCDVIIGSKSRLTNCQVESTNEVIAGTQSKGDTLLCLTLENLANGDEGDDEFALATGSSDDDDEDNSEEDEESEEESEFEDEYTGNEDGLFAY